MKRNPAHRPDRRPQTPRAVPVSEDEMAVLALLRDGRYESVTVRLRNGKIHRIEADEAIDAAREVTALLGEHDFQEITIKQHAGQIQRITRTLKTRP
ncbi:MAG: hypothetical protein RhofKO_04650 [Rhodothermales bacterium]